MAEKKLRIGNRIYVYDSNDVDPVDGQQIESVRSEGQARFAQSPTHVEHVVRLQDLIDRGIAQIVLEVADISDVSDTLAEYDGEDVKTILCIEKGNDTNPDKFCLFRFQEEFVLGEVPTLVYRGKITTGTNGYWVAQGPCFQVGGTTFWGHLLPYTESTCNIGFPAVGELPVVEWDGGYFNELQASKTPVAATDVLRKTEYDALTTLINAAAAIGIPVTSVANIDNPTELAAVVGTPTAPLRLARQVIGSSNDDVATLYVWDVSAGIDDSPRAIGSTGGSWVAIAGRYVNSSLTVGGNFSAAGGAFSGGLTVGSTLGVTGTSTLAAVNTSGVQTHTGQPRFSASWTGSKTLTDSTDYELVATASPAFTWTEDNDIGGIFSGGVFTVANAGLYLFTLIAQGSNSVPSAAKDNSLYLLKQTGGTGPFNAVSQQVQAAGGTHFGNVLCVQLYLNAGDKLQVKVRQDSGNDATLTAAQFQAVKVA